MATDLLHIVEELYYSSSFRCDLEGHTDTHDWIVGENEIDDIAVDLLFDGDVDNDQLVFTAKLIAWLEGRKPFKSSKIVVKINVAFNGNVLVHNLPPQVAVELANLLGHEGLAVAYHGGSEKYADTLYIHVK